MDNRLLINGEALSPAKFAAPSKEFGIMPFWFWNGEMSYEEIEYQIREYKAKGCPGFYIHARFGVREELGYMNEAWLDRVKFTIEKAQAEGLSAAQVGGTVNMMLSGKEATTLDVDGDDVSVMVEYADDEYDTIVLGYPNYWGTFPMAVATFLERYDFTGKTILPLCTNEGSGMGSSESDIKKSAKGATVKNGLAITGSKAADSKDAVKNWFAANGLI